MRRRQRKEAGRGGGREEEGEVCGEGGKRGREHTDTHRQTRARANIHTHAHTHTRTHTHTHSRARAHSHPHPRTQRCFSDRCECMCVCVITFLRCRHATIHKHKIHAIIYVELAACLRCSNVGTSKRLQPVVVVLNCDCSVRYSLRLLHAVSPVFRQEILFLSRWVGAQRSTYAFWSAPVQFSSFDSPVGGTLRFFSSFSASVKDFSAMILVAFLYTSAAHDVEWQCGMQKGVTW